MVPKYSKLGDSRMFKIITGLFAGPAGVVTDFFASIYGKLIGLLAILAIIAGLGASVYFSWTHTVRMAEEARYAAAQAQQLVKDKTAEVNQLKAIDAAKDQA